MVVSLEICQDLRYRCSKWHTTEGVATATEGTEGAGGKMSYVSDYFEGQYKKYTDLTGYIGGQIGSVIPNVGFGRNLKDVYSGYSDFMKSESSKSGLRASEITTFLSGLPIIGNFIRGVEGVNQLEDLYNNTGKTAYYPSLSSSGASGLGSGGFGFGKMASGINDLYQFYTGDEKDPMYG